MTSNKRTGRLGVEILIEGPMNQDGARKGGLNVLWSSAATLDRHTVRAELEVRDQKIEQLEAHVDTLSKMHAMRYTIIEAAGGEKKLLREAEKSGLLKVRPDGTAQPSPELTARMKER